MNPSILRLKKTLVYTVLFLLTGFTLTAQTGTVRGTVMDNSTGEPLFGVTVAALNTSKGNITDLDGQFSLELPAGSYQIQLSYISYQTVIIENVEVKPGEVNVLGDIIMKEDALELEAVVVTAEAVRSSEAALQTLKRKSAQILDGISSSQLRLTGDGNAVEAAKRVTGVSVEDGKYVYVRGLGDRYSKVTLNGMDIPGLDPDRNSLQMDIFPTNLISNLTVSKTFTADLPADFTGGLMNVETKAFPEEKTTSISISTSYNPSMHFNPDNLAYDGGATDFLGFDDGTRALPNGARSSNIPTPISGAKQDRVVDFINSFDSQLGASRKTSFMDYSASFSTGNQFNLDKNTSVGSPKLGYIFSLSYRNNSRFYDDVVYGEYQRFNNPDQTELRYATIQNGEMGERDVLVGALAGLAYKTAKTKLRLTALHLQNGTSRAGQFSIDNDGEAVGQSGYFAKSDNLEYNQRSLTNVLLHGKHQLSENGWELDWRVSPTMSSTSDPDIRKTAFTYTPVDTLFIAGAGGNPSRIWRSLSEWNISSRVDVKKDYPFRDTKGSLKFGVNHLFKQRDYEILFFDIQFFGSQSWSDFDPNNILDAQNVFPNRPNSIYYQSGNNVPNPNEYSSSIQNTAFYVSNELTLFERLKTVVGLRMENYTQWHTGRDQRYASGDVQNGNNLDNDVVLESMDLFPTANLIYSITKDQNLRFSYAKTIARPSFKEVSYAQILDPITNRIYNGSLFKYSGWDGELVPSDIQNLDMRWELFMPMTQIVSVSAFYKRFANPIELVRIPEQQTSTEFQPRNVGNGQLYGVEFEFRKNMDFISSSLENLMFNGNFTYVTSSIDMSEAEFRARKGFERTGENIEDTRVMAGQAPYLINLGVSYRTNSGDLETGLFYNVKGPVLFIVGSGLYPDIYQNPFNSLNFTLNKKFGEKIVVDFSVSNILNDKMERVYKSYEADDQPFDIFSPGVSFGLGVNYTF